MELDRAEKILRGRERVGMIEVASARKTVLLDYLGVPEDELTPGIVKDWISGKLGQAIEAFVALRSLMAVMAVPKNERDNSTKCYEGLQAMSHRQLRRWIVTTLARPLLQQARAYGAVLLGVYGLEPALLVNPAAPTHPVSLLLEDDGEAKTGCVGVEDADAMGKPAAAAVQFDVNRAMDLLARMAPAVRDAGVPVPEDFRDKPFEVLGRVLGKIGCSGESLRRFHREDGKVISKTIGYAISTESIRRMAHLSARWESRLLDQVPKNDEDVFEDPAIQAYLDGFDDSPLPLERELGGGLVWPLEESA